MADLKRNSRASLVICGLTPAGVRARYQDFDSQFPGEADLSDWQYGSCITLPPGEASALAVELRELFSPFIFSYTDNPGAYLVAVAAAEHKTVVMAESCTGGMVGALVTAVSGSSDIFWGSMVTYANSAKERVLGVDTLEAHGAVSRETVCSMTAGALRISGADTALAVSGIAGPGGGTPAKPVGTVWFSFATADNKTTLCCRFSGSREEIRRKAAATALAGCANQISTPLLDTSWIGRYTFY